MCPKMEAESSGGWCLVRVRVRVRVSVWVRVRVRVRVGVGVRVRLRVRVRVGVRVREYMLHLRQGHPCPLGGIVDAHAALVGPAVPCQP